MRSPTEGGCGCSRARRGRCCATGDVSLAGKLLRARLRVLAHIGLESVLPKALLRRNMAAAFETFDTIFVVSEASKMREFVSRCRHPGKIQWIHTDYAAWRS